VDNSFDKLKYEYKLEDVNLESNQITWKDTDDYDDQRAEASIPVEWG